MSVKSQQEKIFKRRICKNISLRYLLFLPKGYAEDSEKRWPLILFLHGAGERGNDLRRVARHGPSKMVEQRPEFPFVVVSPQCPAGQIWDCDAVMALLDDLLRKFRVDRRRVYLTGLSMGGYGSWELALRYPERFAAVAPICGGGNAILVMLPSGRSCAAIRKLPVWAFHGAKDELVNVEESQRMVNALLAIGNQARLTIYPEAGHDCWSVPYAGTELYDWFLEHKARALKNNRARDAIR